MSKKINLIGLKYNKLTILEEAGYIGNKKKRRAVLCLCECQNKIITAAEDVKSGHTKSCGCLNHLSSYNKKNLLNSQFGKLLVISEAKTKDTRAFWLCKCKCGTIKEVCADYLLNGDTKSCGCLKTEKEYEPRIMSAKIVYKNKYADGSLSFDDFLTLTQKNCFYCNKEPSNCSNITKTGKYSKISKSDNNYNFIYSGLDRINSSLPHDIDNIVPCCKECNWAKSNLTFDEFKNWIIKIYNNFIKI